jgi:hypothetical protein
VLTRGGEDDDDDDEGEEIGQQGRQIHGREV